jgi:hypothetical protein
MKLQDHKGYIFTILYYLSALIVSYIVFLIFGWEYIHAPGFHHLTFLLFLIGGMVWSIFNIIQLFRRKGSFYKESLIVHVIILIAFIMVEYPKQEPNTSSGNSITLINSKDTSLLINEMNDTIYLQIKDSIYIDKMNK